MSRENVEILRAAYAAWNAGDMDAHGALHDPGFVLHPPDDWPEPGPFVGRETAMREWEQLRQTWDADSLELIGDFVDAGDRVLARFAWRGIGQGPEAAMQLSYVVTVRDGRIVEGRFMWDHAEALEAAGLSE
jgi:ketosteroid isomerase-like protein